MLQRIRDNSSGPIAYLVVALITLVFGVWGIGSYFTASSNPVVASVGSTKIKQSQLRRAYQQRYQRLRQLMGDRFDASKISTDKLRKSVLQGLVHDAVIQQYANNANYRVTKGELLARIKQDKTFQRGGQFSAQRYRAILAQAGISPAQYEAHLRRSLKSRIVRSVIAGSAFAAPAEVDQALHAANQQRNVHYLLFDPGHYQQETDVSRQRIKQYYQQHPDKFQRPARVKLAYVSLSRDNVKTGTPKKKTLRQLYKEKKSQLGTPEKRSADEIRVPIHNGDDAAARKTVQSVLAAAKQQPDRSFKAIADNVSGASYRRIDSASKNALPNAVGKALFKLNTGAISNPVHGDNAWYVLRLKNVTSASTPSFSDSAVQQKLKAMAQKRQRSKVFRKKSRQMDSLAFQAPNSLDTLSDKVGLKIRHTGWISENGGKGIGQYSAVRKAAFSDSVYKDKLNSTLIDLGSDRKLVLRVMDRKPAQLKSLDTVQASIRKTLATQQASRKAREAAQDARNALEKGVSMKKIANKHGAAYKSPGYIAQSANQLDTRIRESAFAMAAPTHKKPAYDVTPTSDGKVAVVEVDGVRQGQGRGKGSGNGKTQRKQIVRQSRAAAARLEYASLGDYLRDQADVTIKRDAIK